jgi:Zn finger protein HypA/HybF involved in hydrogenase expression
MIDNIPTTELTCPKCNYVFETEYYNSGDCSNCGKAHYYWDDGWDYEKEEDTGWEGFMWG